MINVTVLPSAGMSQREDDTIKNEQRRHNTWGSRMHFYRCYLLSFTLNRSKRYEAVLISCKLAKWNVLIKRAIIHTL